MEIFACIIIVCCTAYFGSYFAGEYRRREQLYYDLLSFCNSYSANLNFRQLPLERLVSSSGAVYGKQFNALFSAYAGGGAAAQPGGKHKVGVRLSVTETQYISGFFSVLGKTDGASQQQEIGYYKQYFETRLKEAQEESKKKVPMMQKIGVLTGILLCILII